MEFKVSAILLSIISFCLLAFIIVNSIGDNSGNLFSYMASQVKQIDLQNGSTGGIISIKDKDSISTIIDTLNSFKYSSEEELLPASGWSYSIRIFEYDGTNNPSRIFITDSTVKMDNIKYQSSSDNYFTNFIDQWMP